MALTASVKEELSRLDIKKSSVRKAEVSAMLRFAGGLHIISGRIVIEAEVDLASTARRLRAAIAEVYGHQSEIIVVSGGGLRRGSRYVVRVVRDGEALARQTGLLDAPRPARPRPALRGGQRLRRGRRGRLARRVPGPRLAHRARPLLRHGGHLPRPRIGPGPRRRRPPPRHPGQGPRGQGSGPRGDPRRRHDRRAADPDGRPRRADGLGRTPHAQGSPRHRQPAGQLRRRQPAPLRAGRRRRRRPRGPRPGDPGRRRPGPPQVRRRAAGRPQAGQPGRTWPPGRPAS